MTNLTPIIERAAEIAIEQKKEIVRRVVETLNASGGLGWTAHTTQANMLAYYKAQFFVNGQLNEAGIQATLKRVGPKKYKAIVEAMGRDFQQQLEEAG